MFNDYVSPCRGLTLTTMEQTSVYERTDAERPDVATAGSDTGSWEQLPWLDGNRGEEACNHHMPEDTTEGAGAGRVFLCRTQPYVSGRGAGSVPTRPEFGGQTSCSGAVHGILLEFRVAAYSCYLLICYQVRSADNS